MRNIKLTIQYEGTRYAGWQTQKNAMAIQEVIELAIKKLIGEKVTLISSGRTDAGVHAEEQIANFKTRSTLPVKNIQKALNRILPKDIVITRAEEVDPKFNAQHNAKSKLYRYTIFAGDFVDPFMRRFAAACRYKLDIDAMRRAAFYLVGRNDFRSFQKSDERDEEDTVRTIRKIKIEKDGSFVYIHIEADGFLYNMARAIAGTLIDVGRGKIQFNKITEILSKKDRRFCGPTAPAKGLCLVKVRY